MTDSPEKKSQEQVVNYAENKEYSDLTSEQNETLKEMNHILRHRGLEFFTKKNTRCIEKQHELRANDIEPLKYILWHRAISSTPPNGLEFDTPDHEIEKFIRSLDE